MQQLVSIIIPAYNTEEYIEEMLECVCEQTYKNLEIIVIDDGSTDATAEIVKNKAGEDSRIKLIQIKNGGVSNARNVGIRSANGEKIFCWDSDDIIESDAIEKAVNFAKENDVNAVLYGYSNYVNGKSQGKFPSKLRNRYKDKEVVEELLPAFLGHSYDDVINWINGKAGLREGKEHTALWRIMLDAKTIRDNNLLFDTNLTLGEDTVFTCRYFLYENSVGYLDECLYYLRQREGSANMSNNQDPVLMATNKLKLIEARKEIDQLAYNIFNTDTMNLWKGTVVFSAVQLAVKLSKNRRSSFSNNLVAFRTYMETDIVKKIVDEFNPNIKFKAIPFYLLKGNLYKIFFVLCYCCPSKIVNKFV